MKFNARIPVIPLPYKSKELAVEKELIIDYGTEGKFPNLYIVDEYDKTKLWDITQGISNSVLSKSGDELTIEIEDLGTIKLGDILNLLYTISLTHKETGWTLDTISEMIPTTIVDNNGIVYAPRTLSKNVYTESGETVDTRLKAISKLGLAMKHVIATEERQQTFVVPYPFENYFDGNVNLTDGVSQVGNSFWVYVGGIMVDSQRYYLSTDKTTITFNDSDDYVEKNRTCTFLFFYNSTTPTGGTLLSMDGKYITPNTIESNRLANMSDSIDLYDPTAIASSKAVCEVRNTLNSKIDNLAGNIAYTALAHESSTSTKIVVIAPGYTLSDGNMLHIRLRQDLGPNATLQVNDGGELPIYNGNNPVSSGPLAGEIINLSYSSIESRFYIYGISSFKLQTTHYHSSPNEGTSEIPFNNLSYDPLSDKLDVYYNGIKLFPNINYRLNNSSITLLDDFVSESGDLFTFELTQIVPVKK